ncbi:hypothetical protein ACFOY4_19640 [Actinomadura syzygii]|uniref:Uncharacterized protein n=1 Tax=Actinomadura syzygii TaxID=1427538 RepID=A0A5D0U414_9ACTN|nr:hypothetical protein [Actinomadura syzygii]TYC12372.1 hypothetical protein FXF65_24280 [Actinomadura syzygii]
MICPSCRDRRHEECRGGSWCDCQHVRRPGADGATRSAADGAAPTGATSDDAEPPVNWRRQG